MTTRGTGDRNDSRGLPSFHNGRRPALIKPLQQCFCEYKNPPKNWNCIPSQHLSDAAEMVQARVPNAA